ncbi:MAG: hypothetical protein J6U93_07450 [Alistipes sp.]|nr:hypothetical protein [Alistipes sp.]
MRKNIVVCIITLFAIGYSANAQSREYNYSDMGYWGNVELSGGALFPGGEIGVSTTNGCRLGNGWAMGIGVGYYLDLQAVHHLISLPFFMEAKYSLHDSNISPYMSLRTGFSITEKLTTGAYISPSIGVNINRWSFFLRYGMNLYPTDVQLFISSVDDDLLEVNTTAIAFVHTLSVGVALNF